MKVAGECLLQAAEGANSNKTPWSESLR